jgi:hypothetical protein
MSFDAWVVGFGIATLLRALHLVDGREAFLVPAAVLVIDVWLLRRFFASARSSGVMPATASTAY